MRGKPLLRRTRGRREGSETIHEMAVSVNTTYGVAMLYCNNSPRWFKTLCRELTGRRPETPCSGGRRVSVLHGAKSRCTMRKSLDRLKMRVS